MKRFLTVFLAAAIVLFGLATGSAGNIQAQGGPDAQNPGAGHAESWTDALVQIRSAAPTAIR